MLPITLPQELIDLIVDEVASDRSERVDTLKTCSLVSKSFSQPARTHIFSNITIEYNIIYERRGTKKFDRVEALWNTLQRDPRLSRKVCAFELNLVEVIRFPRLIGTDYWDWDLSKDRIDQVVLPGIMDTLAEAQRGHTGYRGRLHTLGLGGYDLFLLDWNRLPSKFQQSWWALCAASTLKYLRVGRMRDFPLTLDIGMKPLLRRLELVVELPSSSPTMTLPYAQLASGEGFASFEELECVHLLGWWPPDDICTIIAKTCASTLRTLKIFCPIRMHSAMSIFPSLDLGVLPALHTLTFEMRGIEAEDNLNSLIPLIYFLERSSTNSLHTLRIVLVKNRQPKFEEHEDARRVMRRLDLALSGEAFGALRQVYFRALWAPNYEHIPFPPVDESFLSPGIRPVDLLHFLPLTYTKLGRDAIC